jgi:hypothetical protein
MSIPHVRFIEILTYKAQLVGMQVHIMEKSYTSKASILDGDPLPIYEVQQKEAHIVSGRRGPNRAANGGTTTPRFMAPTIGCATFSPRPVASALARLQRMQQFTPRGYPYARGVWRTGHRASKR